MSLSGVAIRRPVFTVMVTVAIMVLGLIGFRRLGSELYPDVAFPAVVVSVPYPGASPAEIESMVVKPLEESVAGITGLRRVRSFARDSAATVLVLFELGVDVNESADAVRERIAQKRGQLPPEVEAPIITRFDVGAAPVLTYTLHGQMEQAALRKYAEDIIRPAFEQVEGVAVAEVRGGASRELGVELDRVKIDALGLDPAAIIRQLRTGNLSVPAGHYEEGGREVGVRTVAEYTSIEQVRRAIVAATPDGSVVRLSDVARITDGFAAQRSLVRVNGESAVTLEVHKQSGKNTVAVANAVKRRFAELTPTFPATMTASLILDQAQYIEAQVNQVEEDIVFGGLMAILVILVFMLDVRSMLISAVALPTSVVGTFFAMYVLGYTLNMMTLLALSLAIGLLIDDAVVVRENIHKHIERGKPPMQAALDGTKEVALSVMATTLTIVAVFLPIAFVGGMVGQFFREFGVTVSIAVLISLLVAFTLDPMLSARFSKAVDGPRGRFQRVVASFEWLHRHVEHTYRVVLHWALHHRLIVGLLAVGVLSFSVFIAQLTGAEFMAAEDRSQFIVEVEWPAGTSLSENARQTLVVEKDLLAHEDFRLLFAVIGNDDQVNKTKWRVVLKPKSERVASLGELKEIARRAASALPNARVSVMDPPFIEGDSAEAPIMINVLGQDYEEIAQSAHQVAQILKSTPGVGDVHVRHSTGRPGLTVKVNRERAAARGLSAMEIGLALRTAMEGDQAGKLRLDRSQEDVAIKVRLDERYRTDPTALGNLTMQSRSGPVRLADVAVIERGTGAQVLERLDRNRVVAVWATPMGRPLGDVAAEFQPAISALDLTQGTSISYDGQLNSMQENNDNLSLAFALAILFIYVVLASQFESFIHPLTIMITLPLALVGAILALFLTKNTLAMGPMIGIILLMGLVTKNAILLVDRAIVRQRQLGESALVAMALAANERLRPILMTSAAMVLGMLPTALGNNEGSEFRAPMAVAVVGGVLSSTVLSLVVVPVLFVTVEAAKDIVIRIFKQRVAGRSLVRV